MAWLWLYGPPGVGKSTTGFELFDLLARRGERVAFIELDQIGMCMAASVAERSAAKVDNLLGMLDNFASAGADGVIVSGDIVEAMSDLLARAPEPPLLCRLRAADDVTVERLTIRGSLHFAMTSTAYDSHRAPVGDLDVTTHPLPAREVAAEIARRLGAWPPASRVRRPSAGAGASPPMAPAAADDWPVILVTGPRAVGTSTVAWQVLMRSVGSGRCTGYLDLEQLGLLSPVLEEALLATKLANVATCSVGFRARGAERLVLCGHFGDRELRALRRLIPTLRVVSLTARPDTLLERARRRSRRKEIWLPGDDLFGREESEVVELARSAVTFAPPEHADLVVEADALTPSDIAARIEALWSGELA